MLRERQQQILLLIIKHYSETAQAVSSEMLAEALQVSSATVRNDMAAMTESGFLVQPHTSAGRIPSEHGWRMYIEEYLDTEKNLAKNEKELLQAVAKNSSKRDQSKDLAKTIAELAGNAVMVAYSPRDVYYTGLTNLFSQPEFHELSSVVQISQVIDHLDEVLIQVFDTVDGIQVAVGKDNPFSAECGLVMTDFTYDDARGLIAVLGPMRMQYAHTYALLREAITILA